MPTFTLSGVVFFDYNGNGVRDGNEPPVTGASVKVGNLSATSGSDGGYSVGRIPKGKQSVKIAASGFRYISLSAKAFQATSNAVSLTVSGDARRDWGLMEGFLTLPMQCGVQYTIDRFYDRSPDPNRYLWWDGREGDEAGQPRGYAPDHIGVDYYMPIGEPLVAPAPGVVEAVGEDEGGKYLFIRHANGLKTSLGHISRAVVTEGALVARGQKVAESGMSGKNTEAAQYPHTHFQLVYNESVLLDPYGPVFSADEFSGFYDFQGGLHWVPSTVVASPNMQNHWTKMNDPQCGN